VLAVTFADLWFRARQFVIAVVGVGLFLTLALGLSGLADGFHAEVESTVDAVGATSWVMAPAAQLLEVYRELSGGGAEVLARMGPGNYIGELGPILNLPRSASVRAVEESAVTGCTVRAFRQERPHHLVQ
jgi:hypothetical protein